ncbi:MAG: hypothetical protein RIC95_02650 [Vicingaceae bacterium]
MKRFIYIPIITFIGMALFACTTSKPYAFDDVYYNPNNDPVKQVQKDPREDFNKTDNIRYDGSYENRYAEDEKSEEYPQSLYQNRYTRAEKEDNSQSQEQINDNGSTNITINNANNQNGDAEYYDENYASSLSELNSPVRSFNTYDPYVRDRILYTQDPFFCRPTLYNSFNYWDPFTPRTGLSLGWNSWSGWNVGVGVGIGWGFNRWGAANAFYDPFFNPYYDPFWGYNRWGFANPYWGGGFGFNNYWAGYNQGFYNGVNQGNFFVGNGESGSGRRNITAPRRGSGSPTLDRTTNGETERRSRTAPALSREKNNAAPSRTPRNNEKDLRGNARQERLVTEPKRETPEKYRSDRSPNSYTRPTPSRNTESKPSINPRPAVRPTPSRTNTQPTYSRPSRRNNTYNRSNRVQPQRQSQPQRQPQVQPQQKSRPSPSFNRSRPTYNNSSPSIRPSGGSRSTPSRSTPSRSSRPRR